jgi:uncharacterized protein involved in propanediol utilization
VLGVSGKAGATGAFQTSRARENKELLHQSSQPARPGVASSTAAIIASILPWCRLCMRRRRLRLSRLSLLS